MLAAAAAAVANSAKKPSTRPSAASPPSKAPRVLARSPRAPRASPRRPPPAPPRTTLARWTASPPVPRSIASRPQRPVVATPTTFGRLGRFTGGDHRARTADRGDEPTTATRAPPPSSARRARDDALTPTPPASRGRCPSARATSPPPPPIRSPPLRVCASPSPTSRKPRRAPSRPRGTTRRRPPPRAAPPQTRDAPSHSPPETASAPPKRHWSAPLIRPSSRLTTWTTRHRTGVRQSRRTLSRRRRRRRGIAPRPPPPPPRAPPKSPSIDPCPRFPASPTTATRVTSTPRYRYCAAYVVSRTMRGSRGARGASRETSPVFSAFARLAAARRRTRALADAGARGDDARAAGATVVSPMEVKRAVQRRRARFEGFAQHDAHEFMCECLDAVEEEISAAYRDGKIAVERIETTSEMGRAREPEADRLSDGRETPATGSAFTRKRRRRRPPHPTLSAPRHLTPPSTFRGSIPGGTPGTVPLHRTLCPTRRNFTAAVRATLTCDACGDVSERFETFRHLSVDLPPGEAPATLDALLARFFAPESLERRCARDGCEGVCATLAGRVVRLPRVLVVHLKRFRFENSPENAGPENVAPRAAKSTRRVVLPETTSLKAFASRGLLPRGPPPRRPPSPAGEAAATPAAYTPAPGGASPTLPRDAHRRANRRGRGYGRGRGDRGDALVRGRRVPVRSRRRRGDLSTARRRVARRSVHRVRPLRPRACARTTTRGQPSTTKTRGRRRRRRWSEARGRGIGTLPRTRRSRSLTVV